MVYLAVLLFSCLWFRFSSSTLRHDGWRWLTAYRRLGKRSVQQLAAAVALFAASTVPALAAPPINDFTTATTLLVQSQGSDITTVSSGTVVTLVASVALASDSSAVTTGQVNFCDATAAHCTDVHLLGVAQLTSNGTAVLRLRPGIGNHSYRAVFAGTPIAYTSSSSTGSLTVTGTYPTTTTIAKSGTAGAYTLSATVSALVSANAASPTGSVSFQDTSNSNYVLDSGLLGAVTFASGFASQVTYPAGTGTGSNHPYSVATGDFDRDGILDLAVANNAGYVSILHGAADGTFTLQPTALTTGSATQFVAVGDFNHDGISDLVTADSGGNQIGVFLGNADGSFASQVTYSTGSGSKPVAIAVGDLNRDGIQDLAVDNQQSSTVSIFFGNGDGSFTLQAISPSTDAAPIAIVAGDFNGDGFLDLATLNASDLSILLGKSDGTFQPQAIYTGFALTPVLPSALAIGDLNADGTPDLVVTSTLVNNLYILTGNGDGTFQLPVAYQAGNFPQSIAVGDLNGDGVPDLAVANGGDKTVSVLLGIASESGAATGTFATQVTYPTGSSSISVAAGNFNGDGVPDLAVANYASRTASILLGKLTESATASVSGISPVGPNTSSNLVNAGYEGDSLYDASSSGTTSLRDRPVATTLTLSVDPVSGVSTYNDTITLTATLSPSTAQGHSTDGESIAFYYGTVLIDTAQLSSGVATLSTKAVPAGTTNLKAQYSSDDNSDSNFVSSNATPVSFKVNKVTPDLTWAHPAAITFGTPLSDAQLNASSTTPGGSYAYTPAAGEVLNVGDNQTLSVTFTPDDTANFKTVTQTVHITVLQATPDLTWSAPAAITFGTSLSDMQLNASSTVVGGGEYLYTPVSGTMLNAGNNQTLSVTFTPTDTNYKAVTQTVHITVRQATPDLTWDHPAAITFNAPLGPTQLNASSTVVGGGAYVYVPDSGTVLNAGDNQTLSVTFTPTDTNYKAVTQTVHITVNQATPDLTWAHPAAITFNTALGPTQLNASSTVVGGGAYVYTPDAGAVLNAGDNQTLSVVFTPTDTNYKAVTQTVHITVNQATPDLTWTAPAAITYNTPLGPTQLNASSTVVGGGEYLYAPATGTVLQTGDNQTLSVTFTPADTNYKAVTRTVHITVRQATPDLTWSAPAAITYPTTLDATQLNASSTLSGGTYVYTPASGARLDAGANQTLSVTYTPDDTTNYKTVTQTVHITVRQATPDLTWDHPAPITYNTPLGSAQLNASSTVAGGGAYLYTPDSGTVLDEGDNQTLSVTFTPTDTNYKAVTQTVHITVNQATPDLTWAHPAAITYGTPLGATQLNASSTISGGTYVYTPTSGTFLNAGDNQALSVTFTPDGGNYKSATQTVHIKVKQATPTISLAPTASAISYNETLASSTLSGGTASIDGTFAFTSPLTKPDVGTATQSVTFTPADATDYTTATTSVSVTVNPATPTISVSPTATAIAYGQTLANSTLSGGTASVPGTFAFTSPSTAPEPGTSLQPVTFTPTDLVHYTTATTNVSVSVGKLTPTITILPTAGEVQLGLSLAHVTLSGGSGSVAGAFAFTNPTIIPGQGTSSQSVTFTPADIAHYNTVVGTVSVTVVYKAAPAIIRWPTASDITFGQSLASSRLSGGLSSVAGRFVFIAPTDVPRGGTGPEWVTFEPNDTTRYNTATNTVSVTVKKITPTVSSWPTASTINYGQTLANSTLTGGSGSVAGSFAFTSPAVVPHGGTTPQSVTFTPADSTDYSTVTGTVSVMVNKATPNILVPPIANSIRYGQTLASSALNGGQAVTPGVFTFTQPWVRPAVGTALQQITFFPTDTTDYDPSSSTVNVTVTPANKLTPTISAWPTSSSITYGHTLASSVLSGGNASVAGIFSFVGPSNTPSAGAAFQAVIFTPTDTAHYSSVSGAVSVTVNKATPTVNGWPTASSLIYGQSLTYSTLSGGSASVSGSFTFTTPATVPRQGTTSQSVTFIPADTANFNTVSGTVSVTSSLKFGLNWLQYQALQGLINGGSR